MSNSLSNFNRAIRSKTTARVFWKIKQSSRIKFLRRLKKSQPYFDVNSLGNVCRRCCKGSFDAKFSLIKGSQFGKFAENQLNERLKFFHNPNSNKTKKLFEEFFGLDVTEQWKWNNVLPKDAREQLNKWTSKRGEAVHRAQLDTTQPHIIKRDELEKCLRFFEELAKATDKALSVI